MCIRCPKCNSCFTVANALFFVIYDLETSGLHPADGGEIIQIAGARIQNGELVGGDSFFSYCRRERPISRFISEHTGITDRTVRHTPRPIEVLEQFSRFVRDSVIMVHNGHRFDIKSLGSTCARHRVQMRTVESIDTITFSRLLFGATKATGHSLDRVMQRLGIDAAKYKRHDARGDIMALA
jgi:DNA polymerase-3 subunit epsilon